TEKRAIILERDFDIADLATTVNRRRDVLASCFDPLNGFGKLHRNPTEQRFLRIDVQLRSKTAPNFRSDHTQLVFGHPNHECDLRAHEVRDLCRRPERELFFAGEIACEHAAWLHRDRCEPSMQNALFDGAIRGGKSGVDVTFTGGQLVSNVVAERFVYDWTT